MPEQDAIGRGSRDLLAFLDVQSQKYGPDRLEEKLRVTLDAMPFLGQATFKVAEAVTTIPAGTTAVFSLTMTVPPGRNWILQQLGWWAQFAASASAGNTILQAFVSGYPTCGTPPLVSSSLGAPVVVVPPIMRYFDWTDTRKGNVAGSADVSVIGGDKQFAPPLLLSSGMTLGVIGTANSGVNPDIDLHVWAAINELTV